MDPRIQIFIEKMSIVVLCYIILGKPLFLITEYLSFKFLKYKKIEKINSVTFFKIVGNIILIEILIFSKKNTLDLVFYVIGMAVLYGILSSLETEEENIAYYKLIRWIRKLTVKDDSKKNDKE